MGARIIEVTSAAELSAAQKKRVEKVFSDKHKGEKTEFVYRIDLELIGGILVADGDKFYDGTVRSQVDKLDRDYIMSDNFVEAAQMPRKKNRAKSKRKSESELQTPRAETPTEFTAEQIRNNVESELSKHIADYTKSFDVSHVAVWNFAATA